MAPADTPDEPAATPAVSFRDALRYWARLGYVNFGGPAGQIALMHRDLVERRRWISEERFLHALNYCMLLPGPEAQQLAIYVGWLLHRTVGGIVAGVLFVLPGAFVVLALSALYAGWGGVPWVDALFFGLKAAVLAVVVEAVVRIGRRALRSGALVGVAAAAFVAIFLFQVPFPLIVAGAALVGLVGGRLRPELFEPPRPPLPQHAGSGAAVVDSMFDRGDLDHARPSVARAVRVAIVGLIVWWAPVGLVALTLGVDHVLVEEGVFFSKAAVVTFGGAYAVLAYIAQQAVEVHAWLRPGEMLDGLGLAETTPGPLILVTEFVGFVGAHRHPSGMPPLLAGTLGAAMTVWVTFVPSFLWIFVGAPYVESLRGNRLLRGALAAVTGAVVGVILNLSAWFALHVLFADVREEHVAGMRVLVPEWNTLDVVSLALATGAFVAMLRFRANMVATLAVCAAAGLAWRLLMA